MFPKVVITDPEAIIFLLIVAFHQLNNSLCLNFVVHHPCDELSTLRVLKGMIIIRVGRSNLQ